jgi:hypothetical protein
MTTAAQRPLEHTSSNAGLTSANGQVVETASIRQLLGSNLGRNTGYGFHQSIQKNA